MLDPPLMNTARPRDKEPEGDLEKIRKWHEERIARKLRGEYESAVMHLATLVNDNLDVPLHISSVRVEGATNTRRSFLNALIRPHLRSASAKEDSTLSSVLHTTRALSNTLQSTDVFSSLTAHLEESRDALAKDGDVDVVLQARERGRWYLNAGTEFGNDEGSASVTARVRNLLGGAETLEAHASLGTKTRHAYHAILSAPILLSATTGIRSALDTKAELSVFAHEKDCSSWASCSEWVRGVKGAIRTTKLGFGGVHELAYEGVLRHIGSLAPKASLSMRSSAGLSIKSAVSHSWIRDTRDDRFSARGGYYAKISQELAGVGIPSLGRGDAHHYKAEAEGQISRPIPGLKGVTVSFAARTGLLYALSGHSSLFSDRFQLGGPLSVRSFRANSMGPRDGLDSLGGDVYWSTGMSLISDIPNRGHWPLKTHLWVNAGRLDNLDHSKSIQDNLTALGARPSLSLGVGLIYRFDPIRVEVNFGLPIAASKTDGFRRGLQVGMGLDFL